MHHEQLRELCLGLKGATEDIKWGNDLCFCIGSKMFCVTWLGGPFQASFKVTDLEFETLTARPDIEPAAYVGRYNWVQVKNPAALTPVEWDRLVRQSYELVKTSLPKKTQRGIDGL